LGIRRNVLTDLCSCPRSWLQSPPVIRDGVIDAVVHPGAELRDDLAPGRRPRIAFGVMRSRRRRRGPSPLGGAAARSAARARPAVRASASVSTARAVDSAPLRKFTKYSPGSQVRVIPRRANSPTTAWNGETGSLIFKSGLASKRVRCQPQIFALRP
jgi:hypothetical protein